MGDDARACFSRRVVETNGGGIATPDEDQALQAAFERRQRQVEGIHFLASGDLHRMAADGAAQAFPGSLADVLDGKGGDAFLPGLVDDSACERMLRILLQAGSKWQHSGQT